jgi:hypothetical protein
MVEPVKRKSLRLGTALFFVAAVFAGATPATAQDIERAVEKMLNPLPDFDPFDKPAETPRFSRRSRQTRPGVDGGRAHQPP